MKKNLLTLALLLSVMAVNARQQGALSGKFSINAAGDKVQFSQGNLQYQASTNTWRFAEHQTDMIGYPNNSRSATYSGWIDLFTFGSSGADSEIPPYGTYSELTCTTDISGTDYDWGLYNAISNGGNSKGLWRTMNKNEWSYLLDKRSDADLLRSSATVDGVDGYILLPDVWQLPKGLNFVPMVNDFTTNSYTSAQWLQMEAAGAVFLPKAGQYYGEYYNTNYYSDYGYYWTSTTYMDKVLSTVIFLFGTDMAECREYEEPSSASYRALSVRLVADADFYASEKKLQGKFSVSDNEQVQFSQGNLQYNASHDKWQFAENQWEVIGSANKNISPTYNGWIDLFGWGTSGYSNKYPYMTSWKVEEYTDGSTTDIADTYFDWGKYNAIENGGKEEGLWRTMTNAEWEYLLSVRADAEKLQSVATVNNMYCYVLLPDNWVLPNKLWFTPSATSYSTNTYTKDQWAQMEEAGAVLLPCAGFRDGTQVDEVNVYGQYWTSTADPQDFVQAGNVLFGVTQTQLLVDWGTSKAYGFSVRLVRDANEETGIEFISLQDTNSLTKKVMIDGVLYILRDGKAYNVLGAEVK